MATEVPSQQDLYDLFKNEVQARNPELTDFEDGSKLDSLAGGFSTAGQEVTKLIIDQFAKTFLDTANGPEVTGGPDDLQTLATDHFGSGFARPAASPAIGVVDFSRPTTGAGNVLIPAGTIVKTEKDSNGEEQRFATLSDVTMITTAISASVQAVDAGSDGNAQAATVIVIESSLTDPTIAVTNAAQFTGGEAEDTDAEYREFIRNKIETLRGATKAAIEAASNNVAGVETSTAIEDSIPVIEWDIGGSMTVGAFFRIPRVRLFVADVNGVASAALIDNVEAAIAFVKACGVKIDVEAAVALPVDWSASLVLNPSGPNFATLSVDPQLIIDSMSQYLNDLPIGTGFDKGLAKLYIMSVWGPSGTDDLTDFITSVPVGNISATVTEKIIAGTVEVV